MNYLPHRIDKVVVENDWGTNTVSVWFLIAHHSINRYDVLRCVGDDEWKLEPMEPGVAKGNPSLRLPPEALEQLVAAAQDRLPPSAATSQHLDDARAVRDRLLTMIETRGIR